MKPQYKLLLFASFAAGISLCGPWSVHAQQSPSSTASSAANAAGTTLNQQSNTQVNTNTFYGFGPGINCPTSTFAVSGFGGNGSGSSAGDSIGAGVSSSNFGTIATFTIPLGGANAQICQEIGKAQVKALMSQVNRSNVEGAKTQADINLVTALKCVEIQRVAVLTGPFAEICEGVYARGVMQPPVSSVPSMGSGSQATAQLLSPTASTTLVAKSQSVATAPAGKSFISNAPTKASVAETVWSQPIAALPELPPIPPIGGTDLPMVAIGLSDAKPQVTGGINESSIAGLARAELPPLLPASDNTKPWAQADQPPLNAVQITANTRQ